jgi:Ion channel
VKKNKAVSVSVRSRKEEQPSVVNYTTLGYGDVTPLPGWRLLGPMTAMNGVLMFGWSAADI